MTSGLRFTLHLFMSPSSANRLQLMKTHEMQMGKSPSKSRAWAHLRWAEVKWKAFLSDQSLASFLGNNWRCRCQHLWWCGKVEHLWWHRWCCTIFTDFDIFFSKSFADWKKKPPMGWSISLLAHTNSRQQSSPLLTFSSQTIPKTLNVPIAPNLLISV